MATFEQIFSIPPGHALKELTAKHGNYNDDWEHQEYDEHGKFIARYKSWDYAPPRQQHSAGWQKFTPDGVLIEEHKELPL